MSPLKGIIQPGILGWSKQINQLFDLFSHFFARPKKRTKKMTPVSLGLSGCLAPLEAVRILKTRFAQTVQNSFLASSVVLSKCQRGNFYKNALLQGAAKVRSVGLGSLLFWLFVINSIQNVSLAEDLKPSVPDPGIFRTIFSEEEYLQYEVSWTGGIKIGDLSLQIRKSDNGEYAIHARVTDYGIFRFFYPVDDTFITYINGKLKLPHRYEVLQKEGRGSVTRRLTRYDQQGMQVRYQKNDETELLVAVDGPVHNEFSSFYATRAMNLVPGNAFMVPTFADKKRNEVKVQVKGYEELDSVLGRVKTTQVMPIMKFKGLYDKAGDTVIWITDDACRVPVKINSKILIGSLTATLINYHNPACEKYPDS